MILLNRFFLLPQFIVLTCLFTTAQVQTDLNCLVNDKLYKDFHGFHFEVITTSDTIYFKCNNNSQQHKYQIDTVFVFLNFKGKVETVSRSGEILFNYVLIIPPSKILSTPIIKIPVSKYIKPVFSTFSKNELSKMDKVGQNIFKSDCSELQGVSRIKLIVKGISKIDSNSKIKTYTKLEKVFRFICSI